ncbi:U3 small nucleolar RNA-associated protein 4 homolog [Armigeres subalbatus]|uniref:U3 small nucleolar RNA-associated protein 4 homolog n=1 Tax=Armigeres subalbatus TaxID=124917 RepID=UPI002ED2089D
MISKTEPGQCKLHHVQFYNLLPRAINCFSVSENLSKLALARDDGTIEIWNLIGAPFMEKSIAGYEKVSVEALAWVGDRLFSVGLAGTLVEWDLRLLAVKRTILVTGNAAWCLDVSKDEKKLAVGTEGGYINIYSVENDEINYEKILDKQEGRIICIRFDYSGDFLVTGSIDAVRIWNIKKAHAVHKITTGRASRDKETIVWDVLVLKDFTIISGDSRGKIMFFDGNLGTIIDTIPSSKADVLCLAIDDQEKTLYAGGVEPVIKLYEKVEITRANEKVNSFVRTLNRRYHTHDVKALIMFHRKLVSGGVDGSLIVSSFPPLTVDKYLPFLGGRSSIIAEESRMLLLKYVNYLELWTLGSQTVDSEKILQIRSKLDEHIVAFSISSNGNWIIYSTDSTVRLFRFEYRIGGHSRLIRQRTVPEQFEPSYRVVFTNDSKGVFLFKCNGTIDYFTFNEDGDFDHKQTIETGKWFANRIHLTSISEDDNYLVCASLCGAIVVLKREKFGKWKRLTTLPKYKMPPTAIAIQPNSPVLAAVFADHKIFQYDFSEYKFTFSSYLKLDKLGASLNKAVTGIVFDPRNDEVMILQHDCSLVVSQFEESEADHTQRKRRNSGKGSGDEDDGTNPSRRYSLKVLKTYSRLVDSCWLGNDELVVVEANPLSMVEHLPPAYRRKVFGTA